MLGFAIAIPRKQGVLLEWVMCHGYAPNGTAELLIHHLMQCFSREEVSHFTLGIVLFSRYNPSGYLNNPRLINGLLSVIKWGCKYYYSVDGLDYFKKKFCPHIWEDVVLLSTDKTLPLAAIEAVVWVCLF